MAGVEQEEAMCSGLKHASVLAGLVAAHLAFEAGHGAWAEDSSPTGQAAGAGFDDAVTAADLARHRAGDVDVASTIQTTQTQEAHNGGNSITADEVTSGSVYVDGEALRDMHGIGQVVANSGPQANVQGAITLNLILNPPPASP